MPVSILTSDAEEAVSNLRNAIAALHNCSVGTCPAEVGCFLDDPPRVVLPLHTVDALGFLSDLAQSLTDLCDKLVSKIEAQTMLTLTQHMTPPPQPAPSRWEPAPTSKLIPHPPSEAQRGSGHSNNSVVGRVLSGGGGKWSSSSSSAPPPAPVVPAALYVMLEALTARTSADHSVIAVNNPKTGRLQLTAAVPNNITTTEEDPNSGIMSSVYCSGIATNVSNPSSPPNSNLSMMTNNKRHLSVSTSSALGSSGPSSPISPHHRRSPKHAGSGLSGGVGGSSGGGSLFSAGPEARANRRASVAFMSEHGGGGGAGGGSSSSSHLPPVMLPLEGSSIALRECRKLGPEITSILCFPIFNTTTNKPLGVVQLLNSRKSNGFDNDDELMTFRTAVLLSSIVTKHAQLACASKGDLQSVKRALQVAERSSHHHHHQAADTDPAAVLPTTQQSTSPAGGGGGGDKSLLDSPTSLPSYIKPVAPTQLVFRTTNRHTSAYVTGKEYGKSSAPLSDECSLPEVFSYIATIEKMWRDSIDANSVIRKDADKLQNKISTSAQQYGVMELAVKTLNTSVNKMKHDVCTLKTYVHKKEHEEQLAQQQAQARQFSSLHNNKHTTHYHQQHIPHPHTPANTVLSSASVASSRQRGVTPKDGGGQHVSVSAAGGGVVVGSVSDVHSATYPSLGSKKKSATSTKNMRRRTPTSKEKPAASD
eukprot:TRINITY_DN66991_c2_g4_i1.p1 TRINITY_DN66991_c2_g4~~TRINITY_DN66991_c2_g4_i1.p1  ORF type:complete len:704 (-),score=98.09 TRINITY_DN66991_c2_g4_i1:122-2233(-)